MLAPRIHRQAKRPEAQPERAAERREEKDAPETNLLWHLVALRGGGFQPPAGDGLPAHKLTHVTQERPAPRGGGVRDAHPSADAEREAARAESLPVTAAPAREAPRSVPPDTHAAKPADSFTSPNGGAVSTARSRS